MPNLATLIVSAVTLFQGPLPESVLPKPPAPEKVVARVNGVEIRAADVEALLWDWRGQEVTQDLITYQLILGEAKKQKIEAKPAEIDRAYNDRLGEFRRQTAPGADLDDTLRAQGFTRSRLYLRTHTELLVNRIVMRDFRPNDYVRVSTAVYQGDDAAKRASAAHDRLLRGERWSTIVKGSDLDDLSKSAEGNLGWRAVVAFPEGSRPEIRSLNSGGFTKPIALPEGVQIFRVDLRGDEAKDDDASELQENYLARARGHLLQRLRAEAKIERIK